MIQPGGIYKSQLKKKGGFCYLIKKAFDFIFKILLFKPVLIMKKPVFVTPIFNLKISKDKWFINADVNCVLIKGFWKLKYYLLPSATVNFRSENTIYPIISRKGAGAYIRIFKNLNSF